MLTLRSVLFACVVALAGPATDLLAGFVPPIGLAPGSQYQLMFVTADSIVGSYGTEAPYNAFVNAEAAANPSLPSTTWHAAASTFDGTSANVNAPSGGLPVYNTQGVQVSGDGGLYVSRLVDNEMVDQFGNSTPNTDLVWTGGDHFGGGLFGNSLGNTLGNAVIYDSPSIVFFDQEGVYFGLPTGDSLPVWALSGTLTVPTPEPSSIVLLSLGAIAFGAGAIRRRMAKQIT